MTRNVLIGVLLLSCVAAFPAAARDFQPHRATYELTIGRTVPGSPVAGLDGKMIYEWARSCEGTTVMERAEFDIYDTDGNGQTTLVSFSSFERQDGRSYRFATRTLQGDGLEETVRGQAEMDDDGGVLAFAEAGGLERPLAAGTMFPTGHLRKVLSLAHEDGGVFEAPVVLGQREDEPLMLTTVVGRTADDSDLASAEDLRAREPFNVSMGYFLPDTLDGLPLFEVHQKIYPSGVIAEARVVYPEFTLLYHLSSVQALPVPDCD